MPSVIDATAIRSAGSLTLNGVAFDALRLRFKGAPDNGFWTHRNILAEEHLWRARYDRRPDGWFPVRCRHPGESARGGWPPPSGAGSALIALVLVLGLGTLGFATIGFERSTQPEFQQVTSTQPITYRQLSVDSTTALLRASTPQPLTAVGRCWR